MAWLSYEITDDIARDQSNQLVDGLQCVVHTVCMEPISTDYGIKQALAIAIVRQKRRLAHEAESLRTKAQRLEQQLQQQQLSYVQLQQWTTSVLQGAAAGTSPAMDTAGHEDDAGIAGGMFLPPLVMQKSCDAMQSSTQELYMSLQQQLLLAAKAGHSTSSLALAEAMDSKAAVLGDMLLTNIQTLQSLQTITPAGSGQNGALGASSSHGQNSAAGAGGRHITYPADMAAQISSFVLSTLIQTPSSSLRSAYMRRCASLLAALLAHLTAVAPDDSCKQAGATLQHETAVITPEQEELLPAEVVQLMCSLIRHMLHPSTGGSHAAAAADEWHQLLQLQDTGAAASARTMLQQLSLFPSTALLMTVASARQLHMQVQQLQKANAVVQPMQLAGLNSSLLSAACEAAGEAAMTCEQAYELLQQLVSISRRPLLPPQTLDTGRDTTTVMLLRYSKHLSTLRELEGNLLYQCLTVSAKVAALYLHSQHPPLCQVQQSQLCCLLTLTAGRSYNTASYLGACCYEVQLDQSSIDGPCG